MKIDGKQQVATFIAPTGGISCPASHDAPVTPRLVARSAGTEKLMDAGMCARAGHPAGESVVFIEVPGDPRITFEHSRNVSLYFTNTWDSRVPCHQQQLEQGSYGFLQAGGAVHRCTSHADFLRFAGAGDAPLLPDLILHVAGPRLHNFLCQTYLYNPSLALLGHVGQRRVEPLPDLRSVFELERRQDGQVIARYLASDDAVEKVMLAGPDAHDEHEARFSGRASIRFSGTLLFSPDLAFSVGPVQMRATGMQFPEQAAAPVTTSFT